MKLRMTVIGCASILALACGHSPPAEPTSPAPAEATTTPVATSVAVAEPAPPAAAPEAASAAAPAPAAAEPAPVASAPPEATPPAAASASPEKPATPTASATSASRAAPKKAVTAAALAPAKPADAPPAAPEEPCQAARFNFGSVSKACKDGGRKAVRAIMKGAVSKAKAAGTPISCKSCHTDTNSYQLKSNAIADLKLWL